MANVKVFEVDLSKVATRVYSRLLRAQGISGRAENRISRKLREAVRTALNEMLRKAYADGSAPYRTGRSRLIMLRGVRAFGSSFGGVRGHIIGPSYIRAHEEGATIEPIRSKMLAIPLPAALRPDGTPKLGGPRSWKNILGTFIYVSKKTKQAYIAYKNPEGGLTLLYALVEQATLKKYAGFLSNAWDREKPELMEAFGQAMLLEMSRVDLMALSRVTYRGRKRGGT